MEWSACMRNNSLTHTHLRSSHWHTPLPRPPSCS